MTMEVLDSRRDISGSYRVDLNRGDRVGRVSSEWFSRPADERFLSLSDLFASVRGRAERSRSRTVESAAIRVEASRDNSDRLALMLPGSETPVVPTHWSFGQLAALVGAPAAYLRQLPERSNCSIRPSVSRTTSTRLIGRFSGCIRRPIPHRPHRSSSQAMRKNAGRILSPRSRIRYGSRPALSNRSRRPAARPTRSSRQVSPPWGRCRPRRRAIS